jgi:hypothetical protein
MLERQHAVSRFFIGGPRLLVEVGPLFKIGNSGPYLGDKCLIGLMGLLATDRLRSIPGVFLEADVDVNELMSAPGFVVIGDFGLCQHFSDIF